MVCMVFQTGIKMKTNALLKSAFTASLLATAVAASPAFALEAKQCLSMADMNAALKAEGQRTMIIGDRVYVDSPTDDIMDARFNRFLNTVSSNADGSLGYQLEGNKPRAQTSDKVCVAAKLTNVKLFDARKPGLNQAALLGGAFNESIIKSEQNGTRPMVVADSVHRDASGVERIGLPVVLLGNMEVKVGALITRQADGHLVYMQRMSSTEYTAAGLARLNPQVAMVSPK